MIEQQHDAAFADGGGDTTVYRAYLGSHLRCVFDCQSALLPVQSKLVVKIDDETETFLRRNQSGFGHRNNGKGSISLPVQLQAYDTQERRQANA